MGKIINKIIFATLILVLVFMLSSCIGGQTQRRSLYKGTTGLVVEFSDSTPDTTYEDSSFPLVMRITNDGTHTITKENPAIISVITDKLYFSLESENYEKEVYLEGRSELFPDGEILIPELPFVKSNILYGAIQNPKSDIYFSMCYPYETTFSENICMDFDIHEMDQREKVCKSKELVFTGGQGAPIAITKITPVMKVYNNLELRPIFMIEIQNRAKGLPWYNNEKKCSVSETPDKSSWNKIKISGTLSSLDLNCGSEPVRLIDNKGIFKCEVDGVFPKGTNYLSSINFKLEYNYIESVSKTIEITRTNEQDFFASTDMCEGKQDGEKCSKSSEKYCYDNECMDKCNYCAITYPNSDPNVDCGSISTGYKCACSDDDLPKFVNQAFYQKGACSHLTCCLKIGELKIGMASHLGTGIYNPIIGYTEGLYKDKGVSYNFKPMLDFYSSWYDCIIEFDGKEIKSQCGNPPTLEIDPNNYKTNSFHLLKMKVVEGDTILREKTIGLIMLNRNLKIRLSPQCIRRTVFPDYPLEEVDDPIDGTNILPTSLEEGELSVEMSMRTTQGNYGDYQPITINTIELSTEQIYQFKSRIGETDPGTYCNFILYNSEGIIKKQKAGECNENIIITEINPNDYTTNQEYILIAKEYHTNQMTTEIQSKTITITFKPEITPEDIMINTQCTFTEPEECQEEEIIETIEETEEVIIIPTEGDSLLIPDGTEIPEECMIPIQGPSLLSEAILSINEDDPYFDGLQPGQCAAFIKRLLKKVYEIDTEPDKELAEDIGLPCLETWKNGGSNDAWDIAVCFMKRNEIFDMASPTGALTEIDMKPGDMIFTINKKSWCKWSGYNFYKKQETQETINYCDEVNDENALRDGPLDNGYCTEPTITNYNPTTLPNYCDFNENQQEFSNFPIVTHIAIYLGNGRATYFNYDVKIEDGTINNFISSIGGDGIRILVRPDYPGFDEEEITEVILETVEEEEEEETLYQYYSKNTTRRIVTNVNQYDPYFQTYSTETNVPINKLKGVMGIESHGDANNNLVRNWGPSGEIGLMQIIPFYNSGSILHYQDCLNTGCMSVQVEESMSLDQKREAIKSEYLNSAKTICCGAHILKMKTYGSITWNTANMPNCDLERPTIIYRNWDAGLRRYNGVGCPPTQGSLYYVEMVNELAAAFARADLVT